MSMPNANRRNNEQESFDELRVFAPSRGNLAVKEESLPYTHVAEPVTVPMKPRRVKSPKKEERVTVAMFLRNAKAMKKVCITAVVLAVAAALIITVSGYNRIAEEQKRINALRDRVEELSVIVETDSKFPVDFGAARQAAQDAGMVYPSSANYGR